MELRLRQPGASGFFHDGPRKVEVELISLQRALEQAGQREAFVKMDIEGSEYDIIRETPELTPAGGLWTVAWPRSIG